MLAIYDCYSGAIFRIILRTVRNRSLAEDLLQEVFLKLWRSSSTLDSTVASLGSWLAAVARHQVLDHFKSGQNQREVRSKPLDMCELHKRLSVPAFDIMSEERVKLLLVGLGRLEARQRQMLEMAYFDGLTQTEMAARMNMPLGTVKSCGRSALRSLKDHLDKSRSRLSRRAANSRSHTAVLPI